MGRWIIFPGLETGRAFVELLGKLQACSLSTMAGGSTAHGGRVGNMEGGSGSESFWARNV